MATRKKLRTAAPPTVYPFIGSGECGHEDGPVATAQLHHALCTLPLAEGYLVADSNSVRLVSDDGIVTTLAGGHEEGFVDGVGAAARFHYITGVAPHPDGGWVVCDSGNYRIRRVLRDGTVSTLAGSDEVVDDDGAGAAASFVDMDGIAPHPEGGWLVVDDCMLRRVLLDGTVSTFAGGENGFAHGLGVAARFGSIHGIASHPDGGWLVADNGNDRLRRVLLDGTVSTLAGSGENTSSDGIGADASFEDLDVVAIDGSRHAVVAEYEKVRVVNIDTAQVTTLAGGGESTGVCLASDASFGCLSSVAIDNDGSVLITDTNVNQIFRITGTGLVAPAEPSAPPEVAAPHPLAQAFGELLESGARSDVTFELGSGETVKAHQTILCARSAYFEAMFARESSFAEADGVVKLPECDSAAALEAVLKWLYTGGAELADAAVAMDTLRLAHGFMADTLVEHCAERLQSLLAVENMLVIFILSDELRVASLRAAALAFCGENFAVLPKEEAGAFMQNHTELALEVFHLAAGRGA